MKILLVDDHKMVLDGLRAVLEKEDDFEIVGEATTGHDAVTLAHRLRPDAVVMDISMPELNGVDATRRLAEGLPGAWIEDPKITDDTWPVLEPHRARITWDANIHSVADIKGLPFVPAMVNVKPSRLGGLRPLLAAYEHCEAHGIGMYGGGQFELGVGRGQIQYLAAMFHPDGPNDVAPGGFNDPHPPAGLPTSPLPVDAHATGFRWA